MHPDEPGRGHSPVPPPADTTWPPRCNRCDPPDRSRTGPPCQPARRNNPDRPPADTTWLPGRSPSARPDHWHTDNPGRPAPGHCPSRRHCERTSRPRHSPAEHPGPPEYMTPRLYWAAALPWSASTRISPAAVCNLPLLERCDRLVPGFGNDGRTGEQQTEKAGANGGFHGEMVLFPWIIANLREVARFAGWIHRRGCARKLAGFPPGSTRACRNSRCRAARSPAGPGPLQY